MTRMARRVASLDVTSPPSTTPATAATGQAVVRSISAAEHLAHLQELDSASFLQTPAWAKVKPEWRPEFLGFHAGDELIGIGLVLHRRLPKLKRTLAYLPEGPVLDWSRSDLAEQLTAMTDHLRSGGAFAVRMGPPVITRRWGAATLKAAIADETLNRLGDVPADAEEPTGVRVESLLREQGWIHQVGEGGFTAGQPQYNFQLPLAGTEEDLLKGMNQQWRRNVKKAAKEGVEVSLGGRDDLAAFHDVYVETAARDSFTPRPRAYFETMFDALNAEDPDRMRLYLARHEGDLVAATTMVRVGTHAWYSYGASTTTKRDVRGSNAIQWQMIRDALAAGATVYDLRGITDTLSGDDPHLGLIQFKVGTGGEAVEYVGEWDLPLSKVLYKAFNLYMKRR
jgi:lipid II:glycine glycyltransferase (peptidoglycan interpeptide bridge formation enzyme)